MKFEVLSFKDRSPDWGLFIVGLFFVIIGFWEAFFILLLGGICLMVDSWFRGLRFRDEQGEYLSLADVVNKIDGSKSVVKKIFMIVQATLIATAVTFGWLDVVPKFAWVTLMFFWPILSYYSDRKWMQKNAEFLR